MDHDCNEHLEWIEEVVFDGAGAVDESTPSGIDCIKVVVEDVDESSSASSSSTHITSQIMPPSTREAGKQGFNHVQNFHLES